MVFEAEFKINEYISLRLENGNTNIYVGEELFNQCKYLLLDIPVEDITLFDEIKSIDEALSKLDNSLEREEVIAYDIPPETEFWAHCSNLQVWVENNYDTKLLHSNLAFPLLKKLTEVGEPIACRVFKEEIIERFTSGYLPVVRYIYEQGYLVFLDIEELNTLFEDYHSSIPYLKNTGFWIKLGNYGFNKKDFHKAFYCYKKCADINPQSELSWVLLGITCTYLGRKYFQKGLNSYERALELNPNSSDCFNGLGYIYSKLKKYKKAKKFCLKSIEMKPNNYYPYAVLAKVYYKKKRYKKAKELYLKTLELHPSYTIAWSILSEINHKERNYKGAIKYANKALKLDPKKYIILYYKAHSLYKMGLYSMAIAAYQQALELDEEDKVGYKIEDHIIYSDLSKIYYKLKDHDKSLEMSKKSLKLNPIIPKVKNPNKLLRKAKKTLYD